MNRRYMKDKTIDDVLKEVFIQGYGYGHNDTVESCYGNQEEKGIEYISNSKAEQEIKAIIIGKLEGLKKESIYHNPDMSDLDFKIISAEYKSHNQAIDQAIDKFKTDKE